MLRRRSYYADLCSKAALADRVNGMLQVTRSPHPQTPNQKHASNPHIQVIRCVYASPSAALWAHACVPPKNGHNRVRNVRIA
jgi:hypothetical protein